MANSNESKAKSIADEILAALREIRLIDPHSHVDPHQPAAKSLNDLLGYHYYTELAHSAGMPVDRLKADGPELARRISEYLPRIENTVQYSWLLDIARDQFGFAGDRIDRSNVDALYDSVERATSRVNHVERTFEHAKLDAIFLTNDFDDPLTGFDAAKYVPCLRCDDLIFKLDQRSTRERFGSAIGHDATTLEGLEAGLDRLFERFVNRGARACAVSLPPDFAPKQVDRTDARHRLDGLLSGHTGDETERYRRRLAYWMFERIAERCERHELPFDLMIGVNRNVYPAGVHQGRDLYDQRTSLRQFADFFNRFINVVFPISVLTHPQNQELCSYAWIFPNVVANGHWWYSNVPAYLEADLRGRLESVPSSKLIGYYSDAYKLEFTAPKFDMYRRCLSRLLAERYVEEGRLPVERAVDLAKTILRDNVERIFPTRSQSLVKSNER